jgi:hypothetical protein
MRNTIVSDVDKVKNHIKKTNDEIEKLMFGIVEGKVVDLEEVTEILNQIRL